MKSMQLALIVMAASLTLAATTTASAETTIRIGTYDSRAVAIAYAPSKFNPVADHMKAYEKAKADGNEKEMKRLEQWGQKHQRQLHRQGFATVPVGDLLVHVRDKLPAVAKDAGVVAIVRACDFHSKQVETVDVTDQLVQLFDPSEQTLKYAREIRAKKPVDLDDLKHDH